MTKVYLLLKLIIRWWMKDNPNPSEHHALDRYRLGEELRSEAKKDDNHQIFNPH